MEPPRRQEITLEVPEVPKEVQDVFEGFMTAARVVKNAFTAPLGFAGLLLSNTVLVCRNVHTATGGSQERNEASFIVRDGASGGQIFVATLADSGGGTGAFEVRLVDVITRIEVLRMNREPACCGDALHVSSRGGGGGVGGGGTDREDGTLGTVRKVFNLGGPRFAVKDASGATVVHVDGPFGAHFTRSPQHEFVVRHPAKSGGVGRVAKKWGIGPAGGAGEEKDLVFGVSFPIDLDVKAKAVVLGAGFLINFVFF